VKSVLFGMGISAVFLIGYFAANLETDY